MNQEELEAELPASLNVPALPSFNVTEKDIMNAPGPVLQVDACNHTMNH